MLKSGANVLYNQGDENQNTQWLQGGDMCIRKDVFLKGLSFNNTFIRWCFGEDVMLSYQIFKKYGEGSLQYLPF